MNINMKMHRLAGANSTRRWAARLRSCLAPAGAYAWVLAALLSSAPAHADDIDIYTKGSTGPTGSVISVVANTAKSTACSLLDANCSASTPARFTDTLLNQINYNMKDALRAVVTSAPGSVLINLTDYANDGTHDVGHIAQEQILVGSVVSTLSSGALSSPIDKRISASAHDAVQRSVGSVSLTDDLYVGILPAGSPPYGDTIAGSWTASGGAGLGGTAADGIEDTVVTATNWQNAPGNGNKVYYYKHTSASSTTQTFLLDAAAAATSNPVLFLIDQTDPTVLKQLNDDRYYSSVCRAGTVLQTTGANTGQCKVAGSPPTYENKIVTIDKNATISATGLVQGRFYKLVVATRDAGKADNFTLVKSASGDGEFWDTDTPPASGTLQSSGFYFPDVRIPPGATINSAKLVFTKAGSNTGSLTYTVAGIDTNVSAGDFSVQDLNSRTWESLDIGSWDISGANPELQVKDLVKAQVNRSGWCSGDGLAFNVSRTTGTSWFLKATSYDTNPVQAARLVIDFDTASGDATACKTNRTVTLAIGAMSEDVNQFANGVMDIHKDKMPGTITATNIDERANLWFSNANKVGLRFALAPVQPGPGVKIVSAKLKLIATGGSPQQIRVAGILNKKGNAEAFFLDPYHLDTLSTTNELEWNPSTWTAGTVYESPDLSSIVQAQIDQSNWTNENTLGFVLRGTAASVSKACAWERNSSAGIAGVDPAQFGSCAARLELVIDDNGTSVETTGRRELVQRIAALPMSGLQPMGEAYLKNARYLAGQFAGFSTDNVADQGSVDTGAPVPPKLAEGECASNTLVYVADNNEDADLAGDLATRYSSFATSVGSSLSCTVSGSAAKDCVVAAAKVLYKGFDPAGAATNASVRTYGINFGATAGGSGGGEGAVDWAQSDPGGGTLRSVADNGGGAAKQASSSAQLVKQLLALIKLVSDSGASVAAPGISVNALNRFEHLDQLYYSLFKPSTRVDWTGNLKRYQLLNSDVADAKGIPAIDFSNGSFFSQEAYSFWNGIKDGADVALGGAASKNTASDRRIFTYLGTNGSSLDQTLNEEVLDTNAAIDETVLGLPLLSSDYLVTGGSLATQAQIDVRRSEIISWLRGTPADNSEFRWAASIHNSPRIVVFDSSPSNTAITVFYGDNRGLLHAVNAGAYTSSDSAVNMDTVTGGGKAGKELFAFVPKELLLNAGKLQNNSQSVTATGYINGLDGDFTLLRDVNASTGALDRVLLFAGMRRGGNNYYALDVSNANIKATDPTPTLKWVIEGGTGDYAEMGQTWSAMSPNRILLGGISQRVLVFGGGYDPAYHDDGAYASKLGVGYTNAVQKGSVLYIADPETGKLIWKSSQLSSANPDYAAIAQMKYSIVATPRLIDRNSDGAYDSIYVVDLAGQVFRFDLKKTATSGSDLISKVTLVATLGATVAGADPVVDNRRFYDSPSVAFLGNDILLALSSGYREEPLSATTKEAFFFLKDKGAFQAVPAINPTITPAALDNITTNAVTAPADMTKPGWYFNFDQGVAEKGIGSPIIFNNGILWSTYVIETSGSACVPDIGKTRLYLVGFDGVGLTTPLATSTTQSRFRDIGLPGLADTAQIIFREGGGLDVAVGVRISDGVSLCAPGVNCPLGGAAFGQLRRSRWFIVDED